MKNDLLNSINDVKALHKEAHGISLELVTQEFRIRRDAMKEAENWTPEKGRAIDAFVAFVVNNAASFLEIFDFTAAAHNLDWTALLGIVEAAQKENFQSRVQPWMLECFGELISGDREERNHRFLEESLELVQSLGCTQSEAHQLVDYVYSRPIGEPTQEVGGVMVTLAALCLANQLDMERDGETELARVWTKVEQIRAKQAAKPKHSPLPEVPK